MDFPGGSDGKESTCNGGGLDSIPGLGRSHGGGRGKPLQYSCLENPMDRGAWRLQSRGSQGVLHDWAAERSAASVCDSKGSTSLTAVVLLLLLRRLSRVQLCAAAPKTYLCLLCAIIHSPHQSCETLLLDTFHIWDTKAQKCGVASQDYISSLCQSQDLNLGTLALKLLFLSKLYRPTY